MKTAFKLLTILYFILHSSALIAQGVPEELTGVWKYKIDGLEGLAIISPTHVAWLVVKNKRPNLNGQTLSTSDKAQAYQSMEDIGILSLIIEKNNRCKTTYIHSHNPSRVGTSFSWDFEVKDGYITYWIIQADGSRGSSGKARKLAGWNDKSDLSSLNGLWKYSKGINGHFLLCGNYAIWFILNDTNAVNINTSTEAGKAQAFEAITSIAAIAQKQSGKGFGLGIWHNLLASDMRAEKQIEFTNTQRINKDFYDVWMVDGAGKPIGNKWQIQRVKN